MYAVIMNLADNSKVFKQSRKVEMVDLVEDGEYHKELCVQEQHGILYRSRSDCKKHISDIRYLCCHCACVDFPVTTL